MMIEGKKFFFNFLILFLLFIYFFLEWNVYSDQRHVHAASVLLWLHKKQMVKKSKMDII